ncbi:hypothetical protein [Acinetobacter celticus]|uniref:DUF11 domain-containing protein n=1 Tax=Acinetobacter celticus TaxID=1891224 RepID=A0A1C3D0U9_9GAMM|nr:hypothetical protein [Acinetobacter celticus]ODA14643.1 hypothetical protein BBP83_02275 [Acinetobacter celticus]
MLTQLKNSLCVVFLSMSALTTTHLVYADDQPLKAEMKVFQLDTSKNTKKELKATDQVKPNSVLEYRVDYLNTSAKNLKNLKLNLPLPVSVNYTGQSFPKDTYASLDGKNFAKAPLTRLENGKKVNIPLREYRALQWNVSELKPKQKISVSAQVRVNTSE